MMSLKTQDIPGAKPKIRHAPRTLIRHQKISQHMPSQSLYPSYSDQYQYPYSQSPGGINQLVGRQENQRSRSYLRKQGENYMGFRSSLQELSPKIAGRSSNEINTSIIGMDKKQKQKSCQMLPKLPNSCPTTYTNSYSSLDNQLYNKYNKYNKSQSNNTPKNEETPSPIQQIEKQKQIRPASNVSVSSMGKNRVENVEVESGGNGKSRGLFRGLGFNIITNNKFVYDMQNRYLNSTTKWAD